MTGESKTQLICACCMAALGAGLLIAGFTVPPSGKIDSSVLVAFGEVMTFVGALFGIDYRARNKDRNKNS